VTVSIVIPVKNGGEDLERCLRAISLQRLTDDERVELVVVDSGSRDGSIELARGHGAILREIPPATFNHGASRNLGASLSSGELLVFVSQDATPIDSDWLERLTRPLREDEQVGGVYGRQIANEDATPPERYFLDFLYGPDPRRQRAAQANELTMETTLFSNANGAIRRSLWERFPFVEDIIMSEDQDWSRRALLDGWCIVYEPRAAVRHSHPYTLSSAFRRFFDSGASADRAYLAGARDSERVLRSSAIRYARGEIGWLVQTGQARWIPYTCIYELSKLAGLLLGARHKHLPLALKRRLSAMPSYWDDPLNAGTAGGADSEPRRAVR
jgi:rhamnosyltransferase